LGSEKASDRLNEAKSDLQQGQDGI